MYLCIVTVRSVDGTAHQYLRLQKTYREPVPTGGSRQRQRVPANLGRVDLVWPHTARLYEP